MMALVSAAVNGLSTNPAFDRMLSSVNLSPSEQACIDNPRIRTLLRGVDAVQDAPTVLRAFQLIYEDMPLLRPAGNFAVSKLATKCRTGAAVHASLEKSLGSEVDHLLPVLRRYFDSIDVTGDGRASFGELKAACTRGSTSLAALASLCLDSESNEEACEANYEAESCGPTFEEFVILVNRGDLDLEKLVDDSEDECEAEPDGEEAASGGASRAVRLEREKHSAQFDGMVEAFVMYERKTGGVTNVGGDTGGRRGRLGEVLRGCFDGARDPELTNALRVVYCDSPQLRAAGNIVFGVVDKLMQNLVPAGGEQRKSSRAAAQAAPMKQKPAQPETQQQQQETRPPQRQQQQQQPQSDTVVSSVTVVDDATTAPPPSAGEAARLSAVARRVKEEKKDWQSALDYLQESHE